MSLNENGYPIHHFIDLFSKKIRGIVIQQGRKDLH